MARVGTGFVAPGIVALAACSSFGAEKTGTPADATSPDASSDASTQPFCASLSPPPTFCDDFDAPKNPLGYRWNGTNTSNGGTLALDDTIATSSPASARARVDGSGVCGYATLKKDVPAASMVRVAFSIRIGDAAGTMVDAETIILKVRISGANDASPCAGLLYVRPGGAHLVLSTDPAGATGASFASPELTRWPLPGTWIRYELAIAGPVPALTLQADGVSTTDAPIKMSQCALGGGASIDLGIYCQGSPARELRIDDVVVDDH